MAKIYAVVHGAVQGVGFRSFVHSTAEKNHLYGWVRNREDGAVELAAEGEKAAIEHFIQTVKAGNTFSRVDRIEIEDDVTIHHNRQFSIRY